MVMMSSRLYSNRTIMMNTSNRILKQSRIHSTTPIIAHHNVKGTKG